MRMPQGIHSDTGNEVQVPLALSVVDIASLAPSEHQRIARVILEQVTLFQIHYRGGRRSGGGFHDLFMIAGAHDIMTNAPECARRTRRRGRRLPRPYPAQA